MMTDDELDQAVAMRVMGWHESDYAGGPCWNDGEVTIEFIEYWQPSRDIAQAWRVVEQMRALGWDFALRSPQLGLAWEASFGRANEAMLHGDEDYPEAGETPMHAICLASLRAVRAIEEATEIFP